MVRKIISWMTPLIVIMCISTACPTYNIPYNEWGIYNNTETVIFYTINNSQTKHYVYPGDYGKLYDTSIEGKERNVNIFFQDHPDYTTLEVYVKDQKENPIIVWDKNDKDAGDKQFFNGNSWYLRDDIRNDRSEYAYWVFEITSEDLK